MRRIPFIVTKILKEKTNERSGWLHKCVTLNRTNWGLHVPAPSEPSIENEYKTVVKYVAYHENFKSAEKMNATPPGPSRRMLIFYCLPASV